MSCIFMPGNFDGPSFSCPAFSAPRGRVAMEGREGSEGQSHIHEDRDGGSGTEEGIKGLLARDGGLYLDIMYRGPTSSSLRH